ncbi:CAP-Gly domain-containing linker protein 1 [Eurytemora carolleeae]|uniref:CAP-Gly domain-containing linker protein 1 n=1 Tax=Eurytemora carolleeae TaxID=1294199 RepID=UPI000C779126|nr:CAP-Gly domain-containing linker protein 1 [Eurytemora carolleeae]|eukprot:XP_023347472.1 CAP-Gly domain-containing linker protein 1-like [Eurytemora affinis]
MALPGMRGYGRDDNWGGGRNSSYGRNKTSNADYGVGYGGAQTDGFNRTRNQEALTNNTQPGDPAIGRKVDNMDQRLNKHESGQRAILEQMMKMQQDFKLELKKSEQAVNEEKSQRMRLETAIQGTAGRLADIDDRLRRVEDSSRENKNALSQLISHTQNIERAVNLSQQDILTKKDQQATKIAELGLKLNQVQQNKETLEKTCYLIRDEVRELDGKVDTLQLEVQDFQGAVKLQGAMMDKFQSSRLGKPEDGEKEGRMTETQRAMLEAKIMQCQQTILDLSSKLNQEKRERDIDLDEVNSRITGLVSDLSDRDRKREAETREQETRAREQAGLGSAEKQKIIMQISAVQTDLKRTLDERDTKLKEMTVTKLDEMDNKMAEAARLRSQMERDMKTQLEAEVEKQKIALDNSIDTVRKLMETENASTRVKSELLDEIAALEHDGEAREKVIEAKIEDLSDKLRFGMATMQAAVGERRGGGEGGEGGIPLEEVERLQEEAIDGVRESVAKQITQLEEQIKVMKTEMRKQNEMLEDGVRRQEAAGEEASNILGDQLHQKMDSVAFTQERMRRQVEDLQEKISGAPNDIGDIRDRIEDIERALSKKPNHDDDNNNKTSAELINLRKDLDKVLGRDQAGREMIKDLNP